MTGWLLALVPQYGIWLLFLTTLLSCLALPLPASILMMTAGGFVAAGDLTLSSVLLAALAGALIGDQLGFLAGRKGGVGMLAWLHQDPKRGKLTDKAAGYVTAKGDTGIFLSRWLVSPLGPYANLVAGAAGFAWLRFTLSSATGEAVWVGLYVGSGKYFAGNLEAASDMLGSILGILLSGAIMIVLGIWLWSLRSRHPAQANDFI